jgi:hypothetical protein
MAQNTNPIFTLSGDISNNGTTGMNQAVLTAANDYTGIGANNSLVFTADATNGSYVREIRFKAIGTNIASVARIFINNGTTVGTATNNTFYDEVPLPATTISASTATATVVLPLNFVLNPGFKIYWGLGTTVAAGWTANVIGGKY